MLESLGECRRPLYSVLSSSSRSSGACEGPRAPRPAISSRSKSSSSGASLEARDSGLSGGREEMRRGVGDACRDRFGGCCRAGDSREEGVRRGSPPGSLLSEVVMHADGNERLYVFWWERQVSMRTGHKHRAAAPAGVRSAQKSRLSEPPASSLSGGGVGSPNTGA